MPTELYVLMIIGSLVTGIGGMAIGYFKAESIFQPIGGAA